MGTYADSEAKPQTSGSEYVRRVVDDELDELLGTLSALSLDGPKGVGKSVTAERRAKTIYRLDDPSQQMLAYADPAVIIDAPPPVLIDEWQHVPPIWDAVRRAVDRRPVPNQFLLAGSAAPARAPTHSGAGRIVRVRMRPLSLAERWAVPETVSLAELLSGERAAVGGRTSVGVREYVDEILRSGFPGLRRFSGRSLRSQLDGYIARIVDREFPDQEQPLRKPETLRRWLTAYAAATGTTATFEKIRDAAAGGENDPPARGTVAAYREVLERLWILDPVPGWLPSRNPFSRLAQSPKHHLADPALAARLLGIDTRALLGGSGETGAKPRDGTLLGRLFESLVAQSLKVYAQACEARVFHLRSGDGRQEIDLIVERADQRIVAFEVKLGSVVTDDDVRHLHWLRDRLGDDLLDAAVLTTGAHAYRRTDGIAVIPAALLAA